MAEGTRRFSADERRVLLTVKGVGPTVVARFEQLGIADLSTLAGHEPAALVAAIAGHVGSTCWRNSPQARQAVSAAIALARRAVTDADGSD